MKGIKIKNSRIYIGATDKDETVVVFKHCAPKEYYFKKPVESKLKTRMGMTVAETIVKISPRATVALYKLLEDLLFDCGYVKTIKDKYQPHFIKEEEPHD